MVDFLFKIFVITALIVLTILIVLACVFIIYKAVCYYISEKHDIGTWREYYNEIYEKRCKEIEMEYERKLESKSKEYFKEFYDEAMRKKEEQNV